MDPGFSPGKPSGFGCRMILTQPCSAFRLSPKPGILPSYRIIVAIGFQVGHSSSPRTCSTAGRILLVTQIDALRETVRQVRARAPFHIGAWVVLPDHMHCLWNPAGSDADFPSRWRAIKKGFSVSVRSGEPRSGRVLSVKVHRVRRVERQSSVPAKERHR
jgi:hypothetical protein